MSIIEQAQEFYEEQDKVAKTSSLELFNLCLVIYTRNYLSPVVEVDITEFDNWLQLDLLKGNKEFSLLNGITRNEDKIKLYYADNELTRKIREDYINNLSKNRIVYQGTSTTSIKEVEDRENIIKELEEQNVKLKIKVGELDIEKTELKMTLESEIERLKNLIDEKNKKISEFEEVSQNTKSFEIVIRNLQNENEILKLKCEALHNLVKEFQDDIRDIREKGISEYDVIDEFNLDFYSGSLFSEILKLSDIEVRELYNKLQEIKRNKQGAENECSKK